MENVSILSEVAVPKARINGFNIWDLRHLDRKAGWHVVCQNEEHSFFAEFHRLDDAKDFAKKNAVCLECVAVKRENERKYQIKDLTWNLAKEYDYRDNAKFVWMNSGAYSGGRHGGANQISVGFGVGGRSFYGATAQGEARVVMSTDGVPTIVYAYEFWNEDQKRDFVEFTDFEEFKSAMMEMLAPREEQFTKNCRERVAQLEAKLEWHGLSKDEIMVEISKWNVGA
jgi:hypothetical protein